MFCEAAILGLIIGWLRRGNLQQLAQTPLPGWPLALAALVIKVAVWLDFTLGGRVLAPAAPSLQILSYLPLILFVWLNRTQQGMIFMGIGILLNLAVICANGGLMPVAPESLSPELQEELFSGAGSPLHVPLTGETALAILGDRIRIPYGKSFIVSAGDIIMSIGLCLFIQQGMQVKPEHKEKQ